MKDLANYNVMMSWKIIMMSWKRFQDRFIDAFNKTTGTVYAFIVVFIDENVLWKIS